MGITLTNNNNLLIFCSVHLDFIQVHLNFIQVGYHFFVLNHVVELLVTCNVPCSAWQFLQQYTWNEDHKNYGHLYTQNPVWTLY